MNLSKISNKGFCVIQLVIAYVVINQFVAFVKPYFDHSIEEVEIGTEHAKEGLAGLFKPTFLPKS